MKTGLVEQSTFIPFQPLMGAGRTGSREDSRRAEYLLVIYPYGELQDKLLDEQQQFSSNYGPQMTGSMAGASASGAISGASASGSMSGASGAMSGTSGTSGATSGASVSGTMSGAARSAPVGNKPHITVAVFQAGEPMEDTLIRWIQRICNRHKSFAITLNNYSGFPPHTIYLRVQDPQPFKELMQQLKAIDDYIRSSGCPPVNLISRPFLSIAGGLTEQVYNRAMPEYSRRDFHDSFQVEELVLLKRVHAFDACKTVNIFRLLPDTNHQNPS